jgi:hypothetical protein
MKKVTLRFNNLQELSECVYHFGLRHPEINYEQRSFSAVLSAEQIEMAKSLNAIIDESDDSPTVLS